MKKIYLPLLKEQKQRGVYFSSTLSPYRFETDKSTRHEITIQEYNIDRNSAIETERRLKDDKFFNNSHFNYNIIRQ
jgi:hypothetical protein